MRSMLLLGSLLVLSMPGTALAQRVTRESSSQLGSFVRRFERSAAQQGRTDWPDVRQPGSGTRAIITFDPNNADVTLLVHKSAGDERMLAQARSIVAALNLPETDYIVTTGQVVLDMDMELNDYLQRRRLRRDFDLDLYALARALEQADIPRPVVIAVSVLHATRVTLSTPAGDTSLDRSWFASPSEVVPGTRLHYAYAATWRSFVFPLMMLLLPLSAVAAVLRTLRAKAEPAQPKPSPEEVQRRYDKGPAQWVFLLPILLMPLLFVGMRPGEFTSGMELLLPGRASMLFPALMVIAVVASAVANRVQLRRKRLANPEDPTLPHPDDTGPVWSRFAFLAPVLLVMLFPMLMLFLPESASATSLFRRYALWGSLGVLFLAWPATLWLMLRAMRIPQKDGPWLEMVQELAAQAGVRVRGVALYRSAMVNAFATAWGTVVLTTALVRELPPEEVRAVAAHELGHLRQGHARWMLVVSLGITFVAFGAYHAARALVGQPPGSGSLFWRTPIWLIMVLPFLRPILMGWGMRRREEEADRFAVQCTGDPELVIRTLQRLHAANAAPGRLKPSDEALSTHPSLVHRVEAIRRMLGEPTQSVS